MQFETFWYIGLEISQIHEIVMLFEYSVRNFILLASSDNDKPMLMKPKM